MQRLVAVLLILGVVAGVLVGGERIILEQDFQTVELALDLDDVLAQANSESLSQVLAELQDGAIDSLVVTVSPMQQWAPDQLRELSQTIRDAGYRVMLKVGGDEEDGVGQDKPMGQPGVFFGARELATLIALVEPQVVLFGGSQIAGYPEEVPMVASLLWGTGTRFGLQEFAHQGGEAKLARLAPLHTVRVHTIYPRELPKYNIQSARARFLRAVRERSYRLLYVRLWPGQPSAGNELIRELNTSLQEAGYTRGPAASLPPWQTGIGYFIMALGGWLGAGLMLYRILSGLVLGQWKRWVLAGLFGMGVVILGCYLFHDQILARQMVAFLVAITFPTLAVIPQRWAPMRRPNDALFFNGRLLSGAPTRWLALRYATGQFGWAVAITLAGAAVMVAAMGDFRFMLKIAQFRGVKAMFLVPLLFAGAATIIHFLSLGKPLKFRQRWRGMSPGSKALMVLCALAAVVIYVGRTGNFMIPVPELEVWLRESLETLFPFRPRTKEFVIGHPLLILGFGLYAWGWQRAGLVGVAAGTIGQISLLNTFTHVHSSLTASLSRSLWGLLLGAFLGSCLLCITLWLASKHGGHWPLKEDDSGSRTAGGHARGMDRDHPVKG